MEDVQISLPIHADQRLRRGLGQRSSTAGFTLIELLVVIVILSVLAAIALPSFLNQASRARQAEGKLNVGVIIRSQHGYYMENGGFASTLAPLGLNLKNSDYYQFATDIFTNHQTFAGVQVHGARAAAIPQDQVRGYMGKIWLEEQGGQTMIQSVLCEGEVGGRDFMNSRTYCP